MSERRTKTSWRQLLTGLILLVTLFINPLQGFAETDSELNFYVTPILPDSQLAGGASGYFDLNIGVGDQDELGLEIQNGSDQAIEIAITVHTAFTNVNGVVEYAKDAETPDPTLPAMIDEFAGYVYHPSPNNIVTWWGNNDEARARRTGNIDGVYEPITVSYLPDETGHWFVIDYKGQTWRRDVRDWQNPEVTASSFLIAGSTGARNNLHAFMFESMTYTIGTGEVEVNYRDIDTQEEISPTAFLDEPLRTTVTLDPRSGTEDEPYLKGYDFVRVETDSENFDPATNQIAIDAERQVVTYYFKRAESEINVHYVDEDGEERAPSVQLNGYVNDEVEIPVIEIENYAFQFEADDKPLSTRHLREEQEYTLVYRMMGVPSPVDPTDPDNEVSPENPPEIDEDQGLISIDFVSQYIFGDVSISAGTATYPARPQRLLDPQGNPTEERPNYLQISDRRAINDGWTLTATMTENGFQSNEGDSLPGARILLENIEMVTNSMNQSTVPPTYNETAKIEPGIPTPIASALDNQGTGTWVQRYGDLNTMGNSVKLEVPIGADPKQATYRATIEWELRFVP